MNSESVNFADVFAPADIPEKTVVSADFSRLATQHETEARLRDEAENNQLRINAHLSSLGLNEMEIAAWWDKPNHVVDYHPPRQAWPLGASALFMALGITAESPVTIVQIDVA